MFNEIILLIQKSAKKLRSLKELIDELGSLVNFIEGDGVATIIYCFSSFRLDIESCYNKRCFPWFVLLPLIRAAEIVECVRKYLDVTSQNLQSLSPY